MMRSIAIAVISSAVLLMAPRLARAERPTEGGLFSFDPSDVVVHWDDPTGAIRVHYSVEGPSVTRLVDLDENEVPDFVESVGITAADVLEFYADELGLLPPVSEEELGLGQLGGNYALDVYLVDFGGNADGAFGLDACDSSTDRCAGYLSIENDFVGYGYPSLQMAIDTLTSHELFHGVQNAYNAGLPVWLSEGTATWAERQYDPDSRDFLWFADAYLEDTGRSIDRPPTGPVPSFAYGTCLWWDFLTTRHTPDLIRELMEAASAIAEEETLATMESVIIANGDTMADAWLEFVQWNLATGSRAGKMTSYEFAGELDGIAAELDGAAIDDSNRFYPLAATYYRLDHAGGPIWFGVQEASADLHFSLHRVVSGSSDGSVLEALDAWTAAQAGSWALADGMELLDGGYWLVGTQPVLADSSVKVRICLGTKETALACGAEVQDPEDPPDEPEDPPDDPEDPPAGDGGGCSAAGTGSSDGAALLLMMVCASVLRRRKLAYARR